MSGLPHLVSDWIAGTSHELPAIRDLPVCHKLSVPVPAPTGEFFTRPPQVTYLSVTVTCLILTFFLGDYLPQSQHFEGAQNPGLQQPIV